MLLTKNKPKRPSDAKPSSSFSISFDKMSTISGFSVFQPSIERSKWSSWKWEENTYSGFSDRRMGGRTLAGSFQKSNMRMHLSVSTAKQL